MRAVVLGSRIRMMTAAKRCRGTTEGDKPDGSGEGEGHGKWYLGIVLCISCMKGYCFEIKPTFEIDRRNNVSK